VAGRLLVRHVGNGTADRDQIVFAGPVVDLKTAKALGSAMPPLLVHADKRIE